MEESNPIHEAQDPSLAHEKPVTAEIAELKQAADEKIYEEPPQTSIAGFWRRLFAFIIDIFVVGVPLIILGFVIRDIAFSLGPWGRIFGYAIIIPYWGYFNSEKRSGQTFGKKATKIVVVDRNNHYLSLGKSFLRAFTLGLIFMLNGWALPILQNPVIALLVTVIVFGGVFALIYGLVFNKVTRQGIHDLLIGSYVINVPPNLEAITPQTPRIHQQIIYGLLGVGLIIGIAGLLLQRNQPSLGILETGEFGEIQELQSSLLDDDDFFSVGVKRVNRNRVGSPEVLKDLNIEVWTKTSCKRNPSYCNELVNQIARTAFEKYDNIENLSGMRIAVVNRFDFGLASGNLTQGTALSIEDWQKGLEN